MFICGHGTNSSFLATSDKNINGGYVSYHDAIECLDDIFFSCLNLDNLDIDVQLISCEAGIHRNHEILFDLLKQRYSNTRFSVTGYLKNVTLTDILASKENVLSETKRYDKDDSIVYTLVNSSSIPVICTEIDNIVSKSPLRSTERLRKIIEIVKKRCNHSCNFIYVDDLRCEIIEEIDRINKNKGLNTDTSADLNEFLYTLSDFKTKFIDYVRKTRKSEIANIRYHATHTNPLNIGYNLFD